MSKEIKAIQEKAREEFRKTMTDNRSWSWEDVLKKQDTLIEQTYKQGHEDAVGDLVQEAVDYTRAEHKGYKQGQRDLLKEDKKRLLGKLRGSVKGEDKMWEAHNTGYNEAIEEEIYYKDRELDILINK